MNKINVWVEQNLRGDALRILRSGKETMQPSSKLYGMWDRREAISAIRRQIFERSKGECELCSTPVTWGAGHMHELLPRGKGGEISLENSVFVCPACHKHEHRERSPQWTEPAEST